MKKILFVILLTAILVILNACGTPPNPNAPTITLPTELPAEVPPASEESPATEVPYVVVEASPILEKVQYPDSQDDWNFDYELTADEIAKLEATIRTLAASSIEGNPSGFDEIESNWISKFQILGIINAQTDKEARAIYASDFRSIVVQTADGGWGRFPQNIQTGVIYFSTNENGLPDDHFTPFGATTIDAFGVDSIVPVPGGTQKVVISKDGKSITIVNLDASGKPVGWMDSSKNMRKIDPEISAKELFPRKGIDDYQRNPLTEEDFNSRKVVKWLDAILPEILAKVEWDKIKDDVLLMYVGNSIIYDFRSSPNWEDPDKVPPFLRDTQTFGLLTTQNGSRYIFMPLLQLDKKTRTGVWIKVFYALQNSYGKFSKEVVEKKIGYWKNQNITFIQRTPLLPEIPSNYEQELDPFVAKTFNTYPDMKERFYQVATGSPDDKTDHGDWSLLAEDDMYLLGNLRPDDKGLFR